jgi:cytochrome c-type biogenesis protein CcmF
MDLAHLYLPGAVAMWVALFFSLVSLWGYSELWRAQSANGAGPELEATRVFARRAYTFFAVAIVLASFVLAVALLRRDYRIEYVEQYSGNDLPTNFQFAAFWAGQKGSFLIWLLWGSLLGIPLFRTAGAKTEAQVMSVYLLTQLGLLFILVRESPFVMLTETPLDGAGLNPLLQDYWMVIHPPIMFIGYALTATPFAFAIAALLKKDFSSWAARAFPWALAGFLVLGTAILLGGYWAYKTLGWGGYWGWDPVENASFIPWLFGTVLIHGLHLERTRGRYRRANLILACLVYVSVLYGTFLTRSGVLADFSVHSFVDLGISGWLITLMAVFILGPAILLIMRLKDVPTAPNADPFFSRGSFMVLATITILVSATAITIGTSAPLLTRFLPNPGQVGPSFYNRVNMPLALVMAFLLSLVPYLTWRGETFGAIARKLIAPAVFAVIVAVGAAAVAVHSPFHVIFIFLAALALAANLQKVIEKMRAHGLRGVGGYLAHVGVGTILLGIIASSAYDQSAKVTLVQGEPQKVGDLTLTFNRSIPRSATERERMEVAVKADSGLEYLAYPKFFMNDRTRQLMVNPHIHNLWLQDLYISPIEYEEGSAGGAARQVAMSKGESLALGAAQLHFIGFDLQVEGNALAAMEEGKPVAIGAIFDLEQGGQKTRIEPIYRFASNGEVASEPIGLPGGGQLAVAGIDASGGKVQLALIGLGDGGGTPARLAVDVTHKPLIKLVWYGLYVVIAGGLLSLIQRRRDVLVLDSVAARQAD